MSNILSNLKEYVDNLKVLSTDELKKMNLDMTFGKILYSSEYSCVICSCIDIASINMRILGNFKDTRDVLLILHLNKDVMKFDNTNSLELVYIVNDIFSILEDVSNESISTLSNGIFDYIELPETA